MAPIFRTLPALVVALVLGTAPASAAWPPNPYTGGVDLGGMGATPTVIADGAGGTFVAAANRAVGARVQHLNRDGVPQWGLGGMSAGTSGTGSTPANCGMTLDGAGGVVVAWLGAGNRVSAQRFDAGGTPLWGAAGVAVLAATSVDPYPPAVVADGTGGAWISSGRDRIVHGETTPPTGAVSHVGAGGTVIGGVTTSTPVALCPDAAGGVIYVWSENRGSGSDVYAQRMNAAGALVWASGGAVVCNVSSDQFGGVPVPDGAGGVIVVWTDLRDYVSPGYAFDYFAQRLDSTGVMRWFFGGLPVCRATWQRGDLVMASDGQGGAVLAWDDARSLTQFDIYAQRLSSYGGPMWGADGLAICTATGDKTTPAIASDGAGAAFVSWRDQRSGVGTDVYASVVTPSGTPRGLANGFPLALAAGSQSETAMAFANGGGVTAWTDPRPGDSGIRAQRIDPLGFPGDPAPRITAIRDVPDDQGGHVKLSWQASYLDSIPPYDIGLNYPIGDYQVFRLAPPSTWQLLTTVPIGPFATYSAVVVTVADSSGSSPHDATYRVRARWVTTPDAIFWDSAPDSGHSVDNLAPPTPAAFAVVMAGDGAHLSWNPDLDADLAGYRIYRTVRPDDGCDAASLLATVAGTTFVDAESPACVYQLVAVDRHGNVSAPARVTVTSGRPLAIPNVFELANPSPNPARDGAALAFSLPGADRATLEVFDLGGRRIRTWSLTGTRAHRLDWDLRDDGGRTVGPGVYCVRLTAGGETRTRRLAIVR